MSGNVSKKTIFLGYGLSLLLLLLLRWDPKFYDCARPDLTRLWPAAITEARFHTEFAMQEVAVMQ